MPTTNLTVTNEPQQVSDGSKRLTIQVGDATLLICDPVGGTTPAADQAWHSFSNDCAYVTPPSRAWIRTLSGTAVATITDETSTS